MLHCNKLVVMQVRGYIKVSYPQYIRKAPRREIEKPPAQSFQIRPAKFGISANINSSFLHFDLNKSSSFQEPRQLRAYIKAHACLLAGVN
jgi:hypothetical protein